MSPKLSQSLKQGQNLMITPQLQQAIKMLTLTPLEMTNVIAQEMVENPMLEEASSDEPENNSEVDYKAEKLEQENKEAGSESFDEAPIFEKDDFDWKSYIEHYNSNSASAPSMVSKDPDETPNYENMISGSTSLADHLLGQIGIESFTEKQAQIAETIVHNINGDGYLEISIEEISEALDVNIDEVKEMVEVIQHLDPIGCGSANLCECLLLQARLAGVQSDLVEEIIKNHLEKVRTKNYERLAKDLNVEVGSIKNAEAIISEFHPKPGRLVVTEDTHYVLPDIFVQKVGGEFVVQVNDEGLPRLKISQLYQKLLSSAEANQKSGEDSAQDYIQEKLRSAMWLIKSIQNRQKTIYRVSKAIVQRQQEFFKKGPLYLKPMILKDIAEEIGMHESTVSRVTNNKYMHTPIGLFELKYFFNTGLGGKNGGIDISNEALKLKLKKIIENENPLKPLSDQKLATLLTKDDVKIARRTVAKYREIMGIESSSQRRKRA